MQTHQSLRCWRAPMLLVVGMVVLFAVGGCGGDDDEDVPAGASQAGAKVTVTVAEGLTIEPGSDAAELVALWERQVGAIQRGDWEAYRQDCHPRQQDLLTVDQMKLAWSLTWVTLGEGFNVMFTDVRVYGGETANVTLDAFDGPLKDLTGTSRPHEKSNGRWYYTGVPCHLRTDVPWRVVD